MEPVELEKPTRDTSVESGLRILIEDIRLDGVTLLAQELTDPIIASYRNRQLTFQDMEALAYQLTRLYVDAGYVNSQVYIPAQTFTGNVLVLKGLEVRVGEIRYEKGKWFGDRAIRPRLGLEEGDFLNIRPLSRSVRLLNQNPDIALKGRLVKGKTAGTTDIVLQGEERFPIHVTPFWDNLGRETIGNFRMGMTHTNNNALGFGDINTTSVSFTRRSLGVVNQYRLPLGSYGTQVGMEYAYSNVRLGGALKPLDIKARSHIFSPVIYQPLIQRENVGLNMELAFDFKNLDTELLNTPFNRDRLRVLRPSFNGYVHDRWGRSYFNQEFGIGLDVFNGTVGDHGIPSKQGSGTKFFRITGGLTRVQKLPFNTTGVIRSRYQYSPDRLVSAEQLQAGGAYTVRGYPEGQQLGDSGYVLNAEWYVPPLFFLKKARIPFTSQYVRDSVQLVAFADFSQIFVNKPVAGEIRRSSLFGYGTGLRVQLSRFLVARVDLGIPAIRQAGETPKPRLHFGLQSALF